MVSNLPVSDRNQNIKVTIPNVTIRSISFLETDFAKMQNTISPPILKPDSQVITLLTKPTTSIVIIYITSCHNFTTFGDTNIAICDDCDNINFRKHKKMVATLGKVTTKNHKLYIAIKVYHIR